jgi:integration host factor subunit alpha
MRNMVKVDIMRALAFKEHLHFGEAEIQISGLLDILKDTLESGENVLVSGFGKFELRDKKARPGRDPKTMIDYEIDARRVVVFTPSKVWREEINGV